MTLRIGYINAVLALIVVALLGVACYLHLDCRNLEALLAEGKGTEANVLSSSPPAAVAPTLGGMPTSPSAMVAPSVSVTEQLEELRTELAEAEAERERLEQEIAKLEENRMELLKENGFDSDKCIALYDLGNNNELVIDTAIYDYGAEDYLQYT